MSAMSAIWGMGEYLRCPNLTHTHINGNHGGMILLGIHSEYLEESLLATSMDILNKRLDMLIIPHFGKMDSVFSSCGASTTHTLLLMGAHRSQGNPTHKGLINLYQLMLNVCMAISHGYSIHFLIVIGYIYIYDILINHHFSLI